MHILESLVFILCEVIFGFNFTRDLICYMLLASPIIRNDFDIVGMHSIVWRAFSNAWSAFH
jgi:hypothetical protein